MHACVRVAWRPEDTKGVLTSDCTHLSRNAHVYFYGPGEVSHCQPLAAMRGMDQKTLDDNRSTNPTTEQLRSTQHTQHGPALARNSWRELLEIVDAYLTHHGVNG